MKQADFTRLTDHPRPKFLAPAGILSRGRSDENRVQDIGVAIHGFTTFTTRSFDRRREGNEHALATKSNAIPHQERYFDRVCCSMRWSQEIVARPKVTAAVN